MFVKRWNHESTMAMKFQMIQALLAAVFVIMCSIRFDENWYKNLYCAIQIIIKIY